MVHGAPEAQLCAEKSRLASEGRECHVQAKQAEEEGITREVADASSPQVMY